MCPLQAAGNWKADDPRPLVHLQWSARCEITFISVNNIHTPGGTIFKSAKCSHVFLFASLAKGGMRPLHSCSPVVLGLLLWLTLFCCVVSVILKRYRTLYVSQGSSVCILNILQLMFSSAMLFETALTQSSHDAVLRSLISAEIHQLSEIWRRERFSRNIWSSPHSRRRPCVLTIALCFNDGTALHPLSEKAAASARSRGRSAFAQLSVIKSRIEYFPNLISDTPFPPRLAAWLRFCSEKLWAAWAGRSIRVKAASVFLSLWNTQQWHPTTAWLSHSWSSILQLMDESCSAGRCHKNEIQTDDRSCQTEGTCNLRRLRITEGSAAGHNSAESTLQAALRYNCEPLLPAAFWQETLPATKRQRNLSSWRYRQPVLCLRAGNVN